MRAVLLYAAIMSLVFAQGCMRRDGRNVDCRWAREYPLPAATERHLSADAEFAEDLSIRYADSHEGLHTEHYVSNGAYIAARNACLQSLLRQIANQHRVSIEHVSAALGHNRGRIDLAINLPFAWLYGVAAVFVTRWIANTYHARQYGWTATLVVALVGSVLIAILGSLFADLWAGAIEAWRLDNGHLSYRAERVWPVAHRDLLFVQEIIVFWGLFVWRVFRPLSQTAIPARGGKS
jgi:hypothetical protein